MKKAEIFGGYKKMYYLCTRLQEVRALSSVGLEHLPYKQRVGGSTPSAPTKREEGIIFVDTLFFFEEKAFCENNELSFFLLLLQEYLVLTKNPCDYENRYSKRD